MNCEARPAPVMFYALALIPLNPDLEQVLVEAETCMQILLFLSFGDDINQICDRKKLIHGPIRSD